MANSYLTRTPSSDGNRKTMTFSYWIKRITTGVNNNGCVICDEQQSYPTHRISFESDDTMMIRSAVGTSESNSSQLHCRTNRKFRDTSSWYHFVIAIDTTQSADIDKVKLWVNGEQNLSWQADGPDSDQNLDTQFNRGEAIYIGNLNGAYSDMHLAHYHFVDGTALAPTVFGSYNGTTGEWQPILSPSNITYGTNGFWLKFENASSLGTDSSGRSNNWNVNGNLKQSVSTPNNVFNTLNRNESYNTNVATAIKYGGTGWEDAHTGADGPKGTVGNLAMTSGKWYYEMQYIHPAMYSTFGISKANTLAVSKMLNTQYRSPFLQGTEGDGFGCQVANVAILIQRGDNTEQAWLSNASDGNSGITMASNGQVCMCAFDLDAGKIWWGINGTWNTVPGSTTATSSSDIASGNNAHKTWTPDGKFYRTGHSEYNRFGNAAAQKNNFGEGRFGTTAVSSGNADSQGIGVFEFAPPSGFLAICTKNIKTYG
jgi:hypothetical protein